MAKHRSANDNEAITRLPILLHAGPRAENDGWVTGPEEPYGEGHRIIKRQLVRVVPENALAQFVSPKTRATFERTYGCVPEDSRKQLLPLLGIAGALEEEELGQANKLAGEASIKTGKLWPGASIISPWDGMASALNAGLGSAMPVLWQKSESQLVPAVLCVDAAQALFAHALFTITGRFGLRICRRCKKPFFASRGGPHDFCNYRCRVADAMKRYREKLKTQASQRRKKGRLSRRRADRKRR